MKTLCSILGAILGLILFAAPLAAQVGTRWDR